MRRGLARLTLLLATILLCLAASATAAVAANAAVSVFPIPGDLVASPQTQIAFRGVSAARVRGIAVRGSRSGAHSGEIKPDSDGRGASFIPTRPFAPREVVTVRTPLRIIGARHGVFRFTIADPAGQIPFRPLPRVRRTKNNVWSFRSAPGIVPASVKVIRKSRRSAAGDIFVAPQVGPIRDGPEILAPHGNLVWFEPVGPNASVSDFRVQTFHDQPVLTFWRGNVNAGSGRGKDFILDSHYRQVAVVKAANGQMADLHEFQLTSSGTALITSVFPVYWDARSVGRPRHQIVLDSIAQEIDIPTGLVLFQWDSLDHVPLTASYKGPPRPNTRNPYDYFHLNSIDVDRDGKLILSARNTWAAYKVSRRTGSIIWTLGGKHSSFKMGPGAAFAFQHDVRVRSNRDWFVTVFDDGAGPPRVHGQSRGLKLFLDLHHRIARRVSQEQHSPPLSASFEGNLQQLPNFDTFIGWGERPYFTEYDRHGKVVFDARFVSPNLSYRAYRFKWTGTPAYPPSLAASTAGGQELNVYASWNGATEIASWRVLGGSSAGSLTPIASSVSNGFETQVIAPQQAYVAVQALDRAGNVLGQSATVQPS